MSEHQEQVLNETIEAFRQMSVPERPPDTAMLAWLGDRSTDSAQPPAVSSSSNRSGLVRQLRVPSAAAAVLVLGGIGLLLLQGSTSIALADVVKAAHRHQFVRYQEHRITDTQEQSGAVLLSTVYADFTAPRLYSVGHGKDPNGEFVLLSVHDGKHHLMTNSREKTARLDLAPKGYKSLLCCLEDFERKKGVTHEKSRLEGLPAVKYCHVEGKQTTVLWVDATTKLPLRMEQEFVDQSAGILRCRLVWTDFAWDPQLPPGVGSLNELFSTRPPDGYALDDQTGRRQP